MSARHASSRLGGAALLAVLAAASVDSAQAQPSRPAPPPALPGAASGLPAAAPASPSRADANREPTVDLGHEPTPEERARAAAAIEAARKALPAPTGDEIALAKKVLRDAALLVACEEGKAADVRRMLQEGADPDARRASGATALSYAVAGRHTDVVRILLDAHANPNQDTAGLAPLLMASENGDLDVVQALLAAGAAVDAPLHAVDEDLKVREGETALIASAYPTGKASVAKALLGAGADRNAAAADGRTAVLQAVVSENIDVLRALLDAKPDLSARMMAPEPIDAISVALGKRRADLVGLLLAAGADPMVKIDDEVSLLEFAILSGQPDMASMFRNAGVPEPSADRLDELRRAAAEP